LIGRQGTRLVGTDHRGAAQRFDGRQTPDYRVLLGHSTCSKGEASRDDGRQTLGNGGNGEGDGDLEVVDGSLQTSDIEQCASASFGGYSGRETTHVASSCNSYP